MPLRQSWERWLASEGKSPNTVDSYRLAVQSFSEWCVAEDRPTDPTRQTRDDFAEFMIHLLATRSTGTAGSRFRGLRAWFRWLVNEDELDVSPMDGLKAARADVMPPSVPTATPATRAATVQHAHFTNRDRRSSGRHASDRRPGLHTLAPDDCGIHEGSSRRVCGEPADDRTDGDVHRPDPRLAAKCREWPIDFARLCTVGRLGAVAGACCDRERHRRQDNYPPPCHTARLRPIPDRGHRTMTLPVEVSVTRQPGACVLVQRSFPR